MLLKGQELSHIIPVLKRARMRASFADLALVHEQACMHAEDMRTTEAMLGNSTHGASMDTIAIFIQNQPPSVSIHCCLELLVHSVHTWAHHLRLSGDAGLTRRSRGQHSSSVLLDEGDQWHEHS